MTDPLPIKAPRRVETRGISVGRVPEFVVVRVILGTGDLADVALSRDEAVSVAAAILGNLEALKKPEAKPGPRLYLPGPLN